MSTADSQVLGHYRKLMNELLIVRESEGGDLPVEVESAYAAQLDALWWQLSEEEQQTYETELASSPSPPIREEPAFVDREVRKGDHLTPREVAAA